MNVLLIGTDRSLFNPQSESGRRHAAYGAHFDELDIVVFTLRSQNLAVRTLSAGVYVYPTASSSYLSYGFGAFRIAWSLPKPDIVSAQDPFETGLIGLLIARWVGAAFHVQIHTDFLTRAFVRGSLVNRLRRAIAGFVLRRASRIRVVSEGIKDGIEGRYHLSVPITVLPIFVDMEKYARIARTKHSRFKIALLVIGRLEKEKHFTRAIDTLKAARDAGHDTGLTIVGSGSEEGHLRQYARDKGLERFVEFSGWQDDVRPHFSAADLLLVTSDYEGYGRMIVEALAAGVPVLSTDVGIAREAGAMVARSEEFSQALIKWIAGGPRIGELHLYPYASKDEYVRVWCEDMKAAAHE